MLFEPSEKSEAKISTLVPFVCRNTSRMFAVQIRFKWLDYLLTGTADVKLEVNTRASVSPCLKCFVRFQRTKKCFWIKSSNLCWQICISVLFRFFCTRVLDVIYTIRYATTMSCWVNPSQICGDKSKWRFQSLYFHIVWPKKGISHCLFLSLFFICPREMWRR